MLEYLLLSPLTLGLLVALVLWLVWRRLPRVLRYAGLVLELVLLVAMAPVGANLLVRVIESRVPPVSTCGPPVPTVIVLLSGGVDRPARSPDDYAALTLSSVRRLFAAVNLWRKTPDARLVIAGGDAHGTAESLVLASLAERLGVPAAAISTETKSRTTWENARNLAQEAPRLPGRIWLVSSALHLPRARLAFQVFGFEPCDWPSGSIYIPPGFGIGYYFPQSSSLAKSEQALHELVGGWVYAWRARHAPATRAHQKTQLESTPQSEHPSVRYRRAT